MYLRLARLALQHRFSHVVHSFRLATFINQSDPAPWLHPNYRASQLLRAGPPACLATGTQPLTVSAAWSSPSRRHPWRQFRGDTFTRSIREPCPGSCCLYAGHHLGSRRVTPRLIPRYGADPGFDVDLMGFDASTTDIYNHLPGPHLTYSWHAFSCAAHHEPPLTAAAHAGLIPPPARRYRRANKPPSLVQHRSQQARHLSPAHLLAFVFTRQSSANAAVGGLKAAPAGRLRGANPHLLRSTASRSSPTSSSLQRS